MSYHDFSVSIKNAGKENAAGTICDLLLKLQGRKTGEVEEHLKIPGQETWKFAGALPPELLREMALADYYRYDDFLRDFQSLDIVLTGSSGSEPTS